MLTYKKATVDDGELLTNISTTSKRYWNYSEEQLLLWKEDLEINEKYLLSNLVYKVFYSEKLIGFYALKFDETENCYEIDHLWLLPDNIKKGYGKHIFQNIISQLSTLNQTRCILTAEPNAIGFYQKMNGKIISTFESKISGRMLEVYEFKIK